MTIVLNGSSGITTPDVNSDGLTVDTDTLVVDEANNRVGIGTSTFGSSGVSMKDNYNLGWVQVAGESIPNIFRQTSSAATVVACGYRHSATSNGFASSFSSSFAKSAISCGTVAGGITFYADSATTTAAGTDVTPTERLRIDSSGNLLFNTTSAIGSGPTVVFKGPATAGQQALTLHNPATSGTRYFQTFGTEASYTERGYITWNGSTMALSNASDERLKENIVDAPSALAKVDEIKIRSFDFKEDDRHVDYGVIAQELNDVIPSAVFEGSDNEDGSINKPWSVGLEPLIPVLVKAIQELKSINDAQAQTITAQQAALQEALTKIDSLETRIAALEGNNV